MIIQTIYEVKKAHSTIDDKPLLESEKMADVVKWLNKKSNPFNYDVGVYNWDGDEFDSHTITGDEFIHIYNEGEKVPN